MRQFVENPTFWHKGGRDDESDPLALITSSPAFIREHEGNGCAERFIRTLKENLLWVRTFQTIEELRQALLEFKERYNHQRIIARLGYRTPAQAREDACISPGIAA